MGRIGSVLKIAAFGLVLALGVAQVVPVDRSNPPVSADVGAPPEVRPILRRACYDCHSNETVWPSYAAVAPISWLVAHDVHEGRAELNFSRWSSYGDAARRKKLKETAEEVAEGEMPPWYYTLMHPEARLGAEDVATLRAWASSGAASAGPVRTQPPGS
jgi:hypothetical protein